MTMQEKFRPLPTNDDPFVHNPACYGHNISFLEGKYSSVAEYLSPRAVKGLKIFGLPPFSDGGFVVFHLRLPYFNLLYFRATACPAFFDHGIHL
jgi:hypothetical protein